MFSLIFLFTLNNTIKPSPELTSNPPINVPIPIIFPVNNSVSITDDAQFGIKPIKHASIGANNLLFDIKFDILSSPINVKACLKLKKQLI